MADIKDSRLLWIKFILFITTGLLATTVAILLFPDFRLAILMALAIWSFCRAYYFAFYVVERYIDPSFRFDGLISLIRYAIRNRVFVKKADEPKPSVDQSKCSVLF